MQGHYLKFIMQEKERHHGLPLYDWLLKEACKLGLPGGSAFRAVAGFGHSGVLHDSAFIELAGEEPVEVVFALSDADKARLLDHLRPTNLRLFYVSIPAEFGYLGLAN